MELLLSDDDVWFKGRRLFVGVEACLKNTGGRRGSVARQQSRSLASPERNQRRTSFYEMNRRKVKQVWRRKRTETASSEVEEKDSNNVRSITLEEVEEDGNWVERSVVVKSGEPKSYNGVYEILAKELDRNFTLLVLNHVTFMIVLESVALCDDLLQRKNHLATWFHYIEKGSLLERSDRRRTWLSIRGVPLQGWSKRNFLKVASLFGEVLEVDEWSVDGVAREEARVRVWTKELGFICEELVANVGGRGLSIHVSECYHMGSDSWSVQQAYVDSEGRKNGDLFGECDELVKDRGHGEQADGGALIPSCVPESSCAASNMCGEDKQPSGSPSSQKTKTARVDYDIANEALLVQSQRVDRVGTDVNAEGVPPGFEDTTQREPLHDSANFQNSNARFDPIISPEDEVSTDSNLAAQAVALVKLLDGQVVDEHLAKDVIISQRRSQRLAKRQQ